MSGKYFISVKILEFPELAEPIIALRFALLHYCIVFSATMTTIVITFSFFCHNLGFPTDAWCTIIHC